MRIGLFGRGRLGSAIAQAIEGAGEELAWTVGRGETPDPSVDVAIDASHPKAVAEHLEWALTHRVHLAIGTTGWDRDALSRVGEQIGVLVAPNFSLTVALMMRMATVIGRYAALDPESDPYVVDYHHRRKVDAPSGTATALAATLIAACPRKREWTTGTPRPEQLSIGVVRAGAETGSHRVGIDSPGETLELVHRARSRAPFADGALAAARFIHDRHGVFSMDDLAAEALDPLFRFGGAA